MIKNNLIQEKSFNFALDIIGLYKILQDKKEFVLSKQILRSGTSIGANIEEALVGQSKKDFLAKISVASKEARETRYWLQLLNNSQIVQQNYEKYLMEIESIIGILTKIVKTVSRDVKL